MIGALAFLTVVPVRSRAPLGGRTLVAFPVVGLLLGAAWAATAWGATGWDATGGGATTGWSPLVAAALVVAVDLMLTGALHLDAVGDVGDGAAARRAGGDPMPAMRDPRLGAVGAATLVTALLLRFATLATLVVAPWTSALWLAPVVGRTAMVVGLGVAPPVAGSLASTLITAATRGVVALAVLIALAAGTVAVLAGASPTHVAIAVLGGALAAIVATRVGVAAFGRAGGDLIGAAGIGAETFALLVLAWGVTS